MFYGHHWREGKLQKLPKKLRAQNHFHTKRIAEHYFTMCTNRLSAAMFRCNKNVNQKHNSR